MYRKHPRLRSIRKDDHQGESKRDVCGTWENVMKILLIQPCLRPERPHRNFPIGLCYVASAIHRAGYDFEIIDIEAHRYSEQELETLLRQKDFDVVALGTLVTGYKTVKELAALIRNIHHEAIIIVGNSVASSIPEILLSKTDVDIVVIGEGDITIVELLKAIEHNRPLEDVQGICFKKDGAIHCTPKRSVIADINTLPIYNWALFDMKTYLTHAIHDIPEPYPMPSESIHAFVINTARGCPFHCTFCYHVFHEDTYRYRSPESILSEIALLQKKYGINYIAFYDELTFFSKKQVNTFVDVLLQSGLEFFWIADCRANLFTEEDVELLAKLKKSGCIGLGYSLESGNPEILKAMHKTITVEGFARQKKALDLAGLKTFTSLVLGYPQETLETLRQTFDVCYELDVYPSAGYLLPQPGTPMYELAKQKGLITDEEQFLLQMGDRQDLRINLTTIPDDVFQIEVRKHLKRISDKLNLPFSETTLIKTGKRIPSISCVQK